MPAISVVMPVYNTKEYVGKAIQSILDQTFSDFEFLIIDNGSTDGSGDVIARYAQADSRIRVIHNEKNVFIAEARNRALELVQGEYLNLIDSDDWVLPDMLETMYDAYGVGLAAPQVGMLKRIVVIDIGDENGPYVLINPVIKETSGEQTGEEGCLSVPGKSGVVTRPNVVTVEALDINMKPFTLTGEGLLARAICHECEHLDGILYVEHVEGELHDVNYEEEDEE